MKDTIYKLENSLINNNIRTNKNCLNELLHKNYMEIGSSGNIYKREDYFNEDGAGIRELKIVDFSIDILEKDLVLSHYKVIDNERKNTTLRTSIWKKENNKWQIYFHQGTVSKEKYNEKK